jgi:hypothetical protein
MSIIDGRQLDLGAHMDDLLALVGREVLGSTGDAVADLTVELAERGDLPTRLRTGVHEPEDKRLVRLRTDRRGAAASPP